MAELILVMDCHGSGVTVMHESHNQQLVDRLNNQICELESLMQKLHFSLSELQLAHPNSAEIFSGAELRLSDAPLQEPLEFRPARISLC